MGGTLTTRFLSVSCDSHLRFWRDVGSAFCLQLGLHKGEARGEGRDSARLLWAVLVVAVLWAHLSPALVTVTDPEKRKTKLPVRSPPAFRSSLSLV